MSASTKDGDATLIDLLLAGLLTWLVIPGVMIVLERWHVVDIPNSRSSHLTVVYRGGGLACALGAFLTFVVCQLRGQSVPWEALGCVGALGALGLADDIHPLLPATRLVTQVVLGSALGWFVGAQPIWILAGLMVITVTVNVANFMDGINGISGLTIALWGVTALILAVMHHSRDLAPIAAVAAGVSLGFLPANLPTARIFLGDTGSYLLGALVGLGILVGLRDGVPIAALIAPLSVYLSDATFTLGCRAIRHAPLLSAHREHVYQRLVSDRGLSHVLVSAFAVVVAATITTCWLYGPALLAIPVTVGLLGGYLASPRFAWQLRPAGRTECDGQLSGRGQGG